MLLQEEFFSTARERYRIMQQKESGAPPPWTDDHIFQDWRFCCVHREHDRTTAWYRENVRAWFDAQYREASFEDTRMSLMMDMVLSAIAFRWFNKTETGELILGELREPWDSARVVATLENVSPIVSAAYIIAAPSGMSKLEGICQSVDKARDMLPEIMRTVWATLEDAHTALRQIPYVGRFIAYEIVSDLRWTPVLRNASDIMTWASAGPGCARGLGWVWGSDPKMFDMHDDGHQGEMLEVMRDLLAMSQSPHFWPHHWKQWEMREVEHWACEFDKYKRAQNGERLKRRYTHAQD